MDNKIIKGYNFDCLKLSGGGILCSLKGDIGKGADFLANEKKIRISGYNKCEKNYNSVIGGKEVEVIVCDFEDYESFIPHGMAELHADSIEREKHYPYGND